MMILLRCIAGDGRGGPAVEVELVVQPSSDSPPMDELMQGLRDNALNAWQQAHGDDGPEAIIIVTRPLEPVEEVAVALAGRALPV